MNLLSPSFGVFFWQFVTIFAVLFILKFFALKVIVKSLGERKKLIDSSVRNSKEIAERLANMDSLKKDLEIQISQKREDMINEIKVLKCELMDKLNSEIEKKRIEMENNIKNEVEMKRDELMKAYYNIVAGQVVDSTRRFLSKELSSNDNSSIFVKSLVDGLSIEVSRPAK